MTTQETAKKKQDFELYAGEDKTLEISIVDAAGAAYDLTSHTVYWHAALRPNGSALLSKTTSGGITLTDAANGELEVAIADVDTDSEVFTGAAENEYEVTLYHWLKIVDASSNEAIALEGTITVKNNTLRATP